MQPVQPKFQLDAFACPHEKCGAFAHMHWARLREPYAMGNLTSEFVSATCEACKRKSIWYAPGSDSASGYVEPKHGVLIWPRSLSKYEPPHPDMPEICIEDYNEARSIAAASPRAAAALLRLVIEKLCKALGGTGKNIDEDIAALVHQGLAPEVQRTLDAIRVVGNNAVHPGKISKEDTEEIVLSLFTLLNVVVERLVTYPKHVKAIYARLPQGTIDRIELRDKKTAI